MECRALESTQLMIAGRRGVSVTCKCDRFAYENVAWNAGCFAVLATAAVCNATLIAVPFRWLSEDPKLTVWRWLLLCCRAGGECWSGCFAADRQGSSAESES